MPLAYQTPNTKVQRTQDEPMNSQYRTSRQTLQENIAIPEVEIKASC